MKQKNALISVSDKDGIVEFAKELKGLKKNSWNILSSGSTASTINEGGIPSSDVASLVGGTAILGHKVVPLSRELSAGLLADTSNPDEMKEMEKLGIPIIHLVCVDCYPLKKEIAKSGDTLESVIKKTDVGGMNMLHAAAKGRRIVICDANDRPKVIQWLKDGRPDEKEFINYLCAKAEAYCADYELASAMYLGKGKFQGIIGEKKYDLRYGENPWQNGYGLYEDMSNTDPLALSKFKLVAGNNGYVNWTDVDRMLQTITHIAAGFEKNCHSPQHIAVGVKHGNSCGAAVDSQSSMVALQKMLEGNLLSVFGGAIITNFVITDAEAKILANHQSSKKRLLDLVVAPGISPKAIEILKRKDDKCKMLVNPALEELSIESLDTSTLIRKVRGGVLAQENYTFVLDLYDNLSIDGMLEMRTHADVILAWAIGSTSNSNTITLVRDKMLIGNGTGQQDRVECCELAVKRARSMNHRLEDAVAYSDSFFPFNDGPETLIQSGVKTIFASSGSVNDERLRSFCREKNVCLIMIQNKDGRGFYGH